MNNENAKKVIGNIEKIKEALIEVKDEMKVGKELLNELSDIYCSSKEKLNDKQHDLVAKVLTNWLETVSDVSEVITMSQDTIDKRMLDDNITETLLTHISEVKENCISSASEINMMKTFIENIIK